MFWNKCDILGGKKRKKEEEILRVFASVWLFRKMDAEKIYFFQDSSLIYRLGVKILVETYGLYLGLV